MAAKADEIKKLLWRTSIGAVRDMALLLRPSMLDDLGLVPALQWQARETAKGGPGLGGRGHRGMRFRGTALRSTKPACFRIRAGSAAQLRAACGRPPVRIQLRQEADRLLLSVQDDGKGFDARRERGMGLLGIQERVSHLAGTFAVDSEPGHGATVRIVLPLDARWERVSVNSIASAEQERSFSNEGNMVPRFMPLRGLPAFARRQWFRRRAVAGCAVLAAALGSVSCSRTAVTEASTEQPPLVGVMLLGRKDLQRQLTLSSELVPFQEIDVYAKESGFVKDLNGGLRKPGESRPGHGDARNPGAGDAAPAGRRGNQEDGHR